MLFLLLLNLGVKGSMHPGYELIGLAASLGLSLLLDALVELLPKYMSPIVQVIMVFIIIMTSATIVFIHLLLSLVQVILSASHTHIL